jgi:hypothetical protein
MFQLHASTRLVPPQASEEAEVDNDMVPLIRALWSRGWHTMAVHRTPDGGEGEYEPDVGPAHWAQFPIIGNVFGHLSGPVGDLPILVDCTKPYLPSGGL